MWCICFKPQDKFTNYVDEWENEIDSIIINIKEARSLGKRCMEEKSSGGRDLVLERRILQLIEKIDHDIISAKRKAVQFLSDDSTLYPQNQQKWEFYQNYIKKQIDMLRIRKETLKLEKTNTILLNENELLIEHHSKLLKHFSSVAQSRKDELNEAENVINRKYVEDSLKMYQERIIKNPDFIKGKELSSYRLENIFNEYDGEIGKLEKQFLKVREVQNYIKPENNETHQENTSNSDESEEELSFISGYFNEIPFWLEQELESRKLLEIKANLGEIYYEDDTKMGSLGNRLKLSLQKAFRKSSRNSGGEVLQLSV